MPSLIITMQFELSVTEGEDPTFDLDQMKVNELKDVVYDTFEDTHLMLKDGRTIVMKPLSIL
jgi:hypothetical protein